MSRLSLRQVKSCVLTSVLFLGRRTRGQKLYVPCMALSAAAQVAPGTAADYSTRDMRTWTSHAPIMNVKDFKWAKADAWASQAIEKNGKFYSPMNADNLGTLGAVQDPPSVEWT
jgi:hypothetical protein